LNGKSACSCCSVKVSAKLCQKNFLDQTKKKKGKAINGRQATDEKRKFTGKDLEKKHSKIHPYNFQVPRATCQAQIILCPCGHTDAVSGEFSSWP